MAPYENPETESASTPAPCTAANTAAIANANANPTSSPSIIRPITASGSVGGFWPWAASGVNPIASASATLVRTRGISCGEENSGAITNIGVTRASTSRNAIT